MVKEVKDLYRWRDEAIGIHADKRIKEGPVSRVPLDITKSNAAD